MLLLKGGGISPPETLDLLQSWDLKLHKRGLTRPSSSSATTRQCQLPPSKGMDLGKEARGN